MKKILQTSALTVAILGCGVTGAMATTILYESKFNIDGVITDTSSPEISGSLNGSGLGSLSWSTNSAGNHSFVAFFDYEIDETINTYFNEYGQFSGTVSAGQSWEIDEPGYEFGDIYDNFAANTLDNTNALPDTDPDDVSMAMGWDFILAADETATITLTLSDTVPLSGFYLAHLDESTSDSIYFSGSLTIDNGPAVPEPGTMLLMGTGLVGILARRKKDRRQKHTE